MGQDEEREQRLRDLAGFGIDDGARPAGRRGRDRPALPPRPLRRGDHRGRALRAAVGGLGPGREPPARAEGAAGARHPVASARCSRSRTTSRRGAFPVVTVALIAVNVRRLALGGERTPVDPDVLHYGYYPCALQGPCVAPASEVRHLRGSRASSRRCSCTGAGSTSPATCSSCGSSGTTSRTRSAACASCSGTSRPGSRRPRCRRA